MSSLKIECSVKSLNYYTGDDISLGLQDQFGNSISIIMKLDKAKEMGIFIGSRVDVTLEPGA